MGRVALLFRLRYAKWGAEALGTPVASSRWRWLPQFVKSYPSNAACLQAQSLFMSKTSLRIEAAVPALAADSTGGRMQGLAPVVDAQTRLLIVGSFPSVASLHVQQYYAHRYNQLWPILAALWPAYPLPDRADYAARCAWLLARGLGLWDVYDSCERQGSLDSAIRAPQVNDFAALQVRCPALKAVAHNGAESYKHASALQGLGWAAYKLPSTSPAHAAWSLQRKTQAWQAVMQAEKLVN